MPPQQDSFDFPDEPRGPPTTEPTRPAQVTPQGTSIYQIPPDLVVKSQDVDIAEII